MNIIKSFKMLSKFELILWILSVVIVSLSFLIAPSKDFMSYLLKMILNSWISFMGIGFMSLTYIYTVVEPFHETLFTAIFSAFWPLIIILIFSFTKSYFSSSLWIGKAWLPLDIFPKICINSLAPKLSLEKSIKPLKTN